METTYRTFLRSANNYAEFFSAEKIEQETAYLCKRLEKFAKNGTITGQK